MTTHDFAAGASSVCSCCSQRFRYAGSTVHLMASGASGRRDGGTSRYSPLAQINRDNVRNLRRRLTWSSDGVGGAAEARSETTPLMANGRAFLHCRPRSRGGCRRCRNGRETIWQWKNDEGERNEKAPRRGSGPWSRLLTDGRDERVFTITPGFRLVALDLRNGRQISGFGQEGVVDLFKELSIRRRI